MKTQKTKAAKIIGTKTPTIASMRKAIAARTKLIRLSAIRTQEHKSRLLELQNQLCDALLAEKPADASEFRIRVLQDDGWYWNKTTDLLGDVFGDCWCTNKECERCDSDCTPDEAAQEFIDAFEGSGVYAWHAVVEQLNRVTDEWTDTGDGCGGFFSTSDHAPESQIRDQLSGTVPADSEIVHGDGE